MRIKNFEICRIRTWRPKTEDQRGRTEDRIQNTECGGENSTLILSFSKFEAGIATPPQLGLATTGTCEKIWSHIQRSYIEFA